LLHRSRLENLVCAMPGGRLENIYIEYLSTVLGNPTAFSRSAAGEWSVPEGFNSLSTRLREPSSRPFLRSCARVACYLRSAAGPSVHGDIQIATGGREGRAWKKCHWEI
jgi:hypothetical protein